MITVLKIFMKLAVGMMFYAAMQNSFAQSQVLWMNADINPEEILLEPKRCENDNLSPDQARGRVAWAMKCIKELMNKKGLDKRLRMQLFSEQYNLRQALLNGDAKLPFYPHYGVFDANNPKVILYPENYRQAPVDPAVTCSYRPGVNSMESGLPKGVHFVGVCRSSCFHPETGILFDREKSPIGKATLKTKPWVTTLTENATLDDLRFRLSPVENYIQSITPVQHTLIEFVTLSGARLKVTENHPMLMSDGELTAAKDVILGESAFILQSGEVDPIIEANGMSYFGRVHNLFVRTKEDQEHIVVANGILTGSAHFQNDGKDLLNRILLRSRLEAQE